MNIRGVFSEAFFCQPESLWVVDSECKLTPVVFLDQTEPGMVSKSGLNSSLETEKPGMAIDESHGEL